MKRIIKLVFLILTIMFMILFLNRSNNYYENEKILSQEAIEKFEEDLKEGKKINPSNYITPKKDYNNKASKIGMKCSNTIEKLVNKALKKILESIDN